MADFRSVVSHGLFGSAMKTVSLKKRSYICCSALPVCVLPDLNENNTGVEPVEDEEGERDSRNDSPSQQSVELGLDALGDVAVGHEGVEHPEGDVGEEEEGDDLSPRFGSLLSSCCAYSPTCLRDDHS